MAHLLRPSTLFVLLLPVFTTSAVTTGVAHAGVIAPEKPTTSTPGKPAATAPATKTTPTKPATGETPPVAGDPVDAPPTDLPVVEDPLTTPTEPTPSEPPPPTIDPAAVAALQAEARELRDALFKARGRVSTVAARLFTTRVSMRLRSNLERFYTVSNLTITMDGAPVYVQAAGLPTTDGDLFEIFAAPGSHELAVAVDLVSRRDATYKLRIDHAIGFAVDDDARVSTKLMLRETGNMWRLSRRHRGRSDVRVRLDAKSKANKSASKAKPKAAVGASVKGSAK